MPPPSAPPLSPKRRFARPTAPGSAEAPSAANDALNALTPDEREILLLWDAGMSYRQITERTGRPVEAVGILLSRARERLLMAYDLLAT